MMLLLLTSRKQRARGSQVNANRLRCGEYENRTRGDTWVYRVTDVPVEVVCAIVPSMLIERIEPDAEPCNHTMLSVCGVVRSSAAPRPCASATIWSARARLAPL